MDQIRDLICAPIGLLMCLFVPLLTFISLLKDHFYLDNEKIILAILPVLQD